MECDERIITLYPNNRPQPRLSEDEVTIERLKVYLDAAVFEYEIDDDLDIYIKEGAGFPLWLSIDHDAKSIRLYTFFPSGPASFQHVNELNVQYRNVQFALDGDRILANYYLPYRFGIDVRHLIIMTRRFGELCRAARTELGKSNLNASQAEGA